MLDKLREKSRSIGTYFIIGLITFVFVVFFGQGSVGLTDLGGSGSPSYAAKVNGAEISVREFQTAYSSLYRSYQQQAGGQFDEAMAEQLGLKDTILDQLVERRLLIETARESGLAVSNAEVAKAVREIPAFRKNGAFDFDTYKLVLASNVGLSPEKFEDEVRADLLREKMIQQIRQAAKATDDEVRAEYQRDNDKANLSVVRFEAAAFTDEAKPTPAELAAFLATADGKAAVEREFTEKSFRFKQPRRVQAQHILVKVEEDAPEADVEAAEAKLLDAKKQIEEGADFGELAKTLSEDPGSKEQGGDVGFFGPGTMARPFEDAAFALEKGQLSDVVRTRFGMHLIKVNDVEEAKEQTLAEVQDQIAGEIVQQRKAKELAQAKAEEVLAKVKAGASLASLYPAPADDTEPVAAAVVAQETGLFNVDSEYVPNVGVSAAIASAVRTAEKGAALPEVFTVGDSFVVAEVTDRVKPDMERFADSAATYRQRVVARKEASLVQDFTRGLRQQAKIEKNPALFASAEG